MKVLVIDNFDSFVYNIVQAVEGMGHTVKVVDNLSLKSVGEEYRHVIISPGPGNPVNESDRGSLSDFMREAGSRRILGVCFGHQFLAYYLGSSISVGKRQYHGELDVITHEESPIYRGVPKSFSSMRYHSLTVQPSPNVIVDAVSMSDGSVMGFHNREGNIFGVQFHPESHYSEFGNRILENFLAV